MKKCELCGTYVKLLGNVTKYYVPDDEAILKGYGVICIKSKGQVKRIAIQNPDLFEEVVREMGWYRIEEIAEGLPDMAHKIFKKFGYIKKGK